MARAVVILADGFEEIEAVTVIDVLRRAGTEVRAVAAAGISRPVNGAHGVAVRADGCLSDESPGDCDMVVLPGGMPGAENLASDERVLAFVRDVHAGGGYVCAICAAPIALHAAGLLGGVRVTSYPSFAERLVGAKHTGAAVERDGRIITGSGPGTAAAFALELAAVTAGPETAARLRRAMLIDG